ncbi:MAG: hypothetical protein WCJ30_27890, partial [Deltaproteobacteria bacterium]
MTQQVIVQEARGLSAQPDQGVDSRWCVIGNSSIGSVGLSLLLGNTAPVISSYGYGMGPDATTHELARTKVPGAFCKVPNTTAGSYGTIDVTGVTGSALVSNDSTVTPNGEYDAWIRVDTAFTVGATGGALSTSLDGGVNWDGPFNVGTATSYTIANSGAKFLFEPPAAQVTALIAYANDIRTKFLAHIVYTTGTVHGSADSTSDDNVQIAATNLATTITLLPTLLAGLVAHRAKGSTTHITADVDSAVTALVATALAANTAASASGTAQDTITAALATAAAFAAHENTTAGVYHTIRDTVNVVSATVPTRGALAAGDVAKVRTLGPKWAAADLYTAGSPDTGAFAALKASDTSFGLIYIEGPMSASEAATVSAGLDMLNAAGRRPSVIVRARRPAADAAALRAVPLARRGAGGGRLGRRRLLRDLPRRRPLLRQPDRDARQGVGADVRPRRAVGACGSPELPRLPRRGAGAALRRLRPGRYISPRRPPGTPTGSPPR